MESFDTAASAFYKRMVGQVPTEDYVAQNAQESVKAVKELLYPEFSEADKEEFKANLRTQGITTDDPDKMWAGLTQMAEESIVKEWAQKLGLESGATKDHVNTAIQVQKNIGANLDRRANFGQRLG